LKSRLPCHKIYSESKTTRPRTAGITPAGLHQQNVGRSMKKQKDAQPHAQRRRPELLECTTLKYSHQRAAVHKYRLSFTKDQLLYKFWDHQNI
jgi:hypothetical protein